MPIGPLAGRDLSPTIAGPDSAAREWVLAVASASEITRVPRGLYVHTGGTIDVEDDVPTAMTMTVLAGEWLPISPTKITAIGGAVVYLLY